MLDYFPELKNLMNSMNLFYWCKFMGFMGLWDYFWDYIMGLFSSIKESYECHEPILLVQIYGMIMHLT